jgi:sialic acid synthase SpsE
MRIGDIDLSDRVPVIAEIGNNHEGDADLARKMVLAAAEAGADAVKFQTFTAENFVAPSDERRYAQLESYELSQDTFRELGELAREHGMLFISTPLDLPSAEFLATCADAIKIASGDNTFFPLIELVAKSDLPLIISTGLADLEVVERAVATVEGIRGPGADARLAIMHCVSAYPAAPEDLGLRAIPYLRERLDHPIGYSDHSLGDEAAVAAVALGARLVEKHFTLEGIESDFRDHELSATPDELAGLVRSVQRVSVMLGSEEKEPTEGEREVAEALRRSIVAADDLPAGHTLAWEDLGWVRPGGGFAPGEEERVIGLTLAADVAKGAQILPEHLG